MISEDCSVGLLPHLRNRRWPPLPHHQGRAVPPRVAQLASAASRGNIRAQRWSLGIRHPRHRAIAPSSRGARRAAGARPRGPRFQVQDTKPRRRRQLPRKISPSPAVGLMATPRDKTATASEPPASNEQEQSRAVSRPTGIFFLSLSQI